jgi:hypothetical protein
VWAREETTGQRPGRVSGSRAAGGNRESPLDLPRSLLPTSTTRNVLVMVATQKATRLATSLADFLTPTSNRKNSGLP